jgi:hypothetical protein
MLGCNHQKWIEMGELVVEPLEKLGTGQAIQVTRCHKYGSKKVL